MRRLVAWGEQAGCLTLIVATGLIACTLALAVVGVMSRLGR